jgi:ZIP family zinc transporter
VPSTWSASSSDSSKRRLDAAETSDEVSTLPSDFLTVVLIAGAAAIASPVGGLIALWRRPTSLFMSGALGFASGALLGSITFEMLPSALELSSPLLTIAGFVAGFAIVYAFDLFINRGLLAGKKADEYPAARQFHRRHRPRGDDATVLAGGTSVDEVIEGLSIGVGFAVKPGVGLLIAAAILIDNISEALSIGEIIRDQRSSDKRSETWRILKWTGLIGISVFVASLVGWFFLRDLPHPLLGFLLGAGAGGMFYLTVTDLLPQAEERQYQQLPAIMMGISMMIILALSNVV